MAEHIGDAPCGVSPAAGSRCEIAVTGRTIDTHLECFWEKLKEPAR